MKSFENMNTLLQAIYKTRSAQTLLTTTIFYSIFFFEYSVSWQVSSMSVMFVKGFLILWISRYRSFPFFIMFKNISVYLPLGISLSIRPLRASLSMLSCLSNMAYPYCCPFSKCPYSKFRKQARVTPIFSRIH